MRKLLVVDDDEALRRLLRLELEEFYEVIDTGEPEQGLALALEHRPNAILLDLRMPNYSGYELCQRFRSLSHTQKIPVVIVSGEAGAETKAFCEQLGAVAYFEKPIDFEALKSRLSEVATPRRYIPRNEIRVSLRVTLTLRGSDAGGKVFEGAATTENVSLVGFSCTFDTDIPLHSVVDVYMGKGRNEHVGKAEVVFAEAATDILRRYGCRFTERTGSWVLQ